MRKRGNNEGSIYKRKDGRWTAAITLPVGARKSFYGATRQEVAAKLAEAIRNKDKGLPAINERRTLAAYLQEWLAAVRPTVRASTWDRYEQYVRVHLTPAIGRYALARLTPAQINAFCASKLDGNLSPTTVAHMHTVLHTALERAVRWGYVARNVVALADRPRMAHAEMRTFTAEQARAFLIGVRGDRFEALYTLALSTGMRQGELLALRWEHVNLEESALQVRATVYRGKDGMVFGEPKTDRSRRQVSLTPTAVEALRRHRVRQVAERLRSGSSWDDLDLVFPNEIGRPVEPGNLLRRSYWPLLEQAGLPRLRFHDLRHSAATLLLERGTHPKIVADMLGHSQVSVTLDRYSHVTPTMHRQAADTMEVILHAVGD